MTTIASGPGGPWRVALVDDDSVVLRSISRMLTLCGYDVTTFTSAAAFLAALDSWRPEIAVVDLRMPDSDGLTLQAVMAERGIRVPTVFLSGHGDVATSVRAIRGGAVDFLEKPVDEPTLLASLQRAADVARRDREQDAAHQSIADRAATLTRREHEVFHWVVTGRLNKQIAAALGTTEKTIKVHRGRVMTKMRAESIADLVRMFDQLDEPSLLSEGDAAPPPPDAKRLRQQSRRTGGVGKPT